MKKHMQKIWERLTYRLLFVICSTFLPLIIMAMIGSGMVLWKSSNEVLDSWQRELNFSMTRMEADLRKVDEKVDDFVLAYLTELTLADSSDTMVTYGMVGELGEIFEDTDMKGILYLYDCVQDRVFVKYSRDAYSIVEIENMKALLEKETPRESSLQWQLCELGGRYFYMRHYEYTNYRTGFLIDMERSLEMMLSEELTRDREVCFTDGAQILRMREDTLLEETELTWEELLENHIRIQSVEWGSQALGCRVGIRMSRGVFLQSVPRSYWLLMLAGILSIFLIVYLWKALQVRVVRPLCVLQHAMEQLEEENLEYRIVNEDQDETQEFLYLYDAFNRMAQEVKLSREKDSKMYQVQLDNLRLQVNPHMLLNSFNMIYSLAQVKNYACIQEFSLHLVEYFRYVLKETDSFVTLEKELHFVESYIGIQKIRFPGAFTSVYHVEQCAQKALVPPLLVENFVENAMKYALVPGKVIEVLINIRRSEDRLFVSICDTGNGIKEEVLQCIQKGEMYVDKRGHKHIGIWNCRRRMEVFYGETASMNIISRRGEGTQVWLDLPYLEQEGMR